MIKIFALHLKPGRYDWIDYAKGIAIFLVVYRHAFEGLKRSGLNASDYLGLEYANIMFFSFRMPLFFIISGMFISSSLAKRGFRLLLSQKAKAILYPYFLWGVFQITLQIILSSFVNSDRSFNDYGYLIYAPREVDQFWYLYALFNVTILYAFLKAHLRLRHASQLLLGVVMYCLSAYATQNALNVGFVQDVCHYYIFFVIGDIVGVHFRNEKNTKKIGSIGVLLCLFPLFILGQVYFLYSNVQNDPLSYQYVERFQPTLFFLIAIVGSLFIIVISFVLQRFSMFKWLRVIGIHSLYIYVMHVVIASATRIVLTKFLGITYFPVVLLFGIVNSVCIPILFYRLCQSKGWYFIFTLNKPAIKVQNN